MSAHVGAISSISSLINKAAFTQPKGDFAGRLNSTVTVAILATSAGLLLSTHFVGDPITCWTPAEFPKIWIDFVNQFCYVEGTYFSHLSHPLDFDEEHRQQHFIDYYQWVPYVLAIMAVFFYLPRFVWRMLSSFSGYDLNGCVQYIDNVWNKITASNFQARLDLMEKQAAVYVWDGIRLSRRRQRGQMVTYYVTYTIVQTSISFVMFWWLNELIDSPLYSFSGPSVIADLLRGREWQETGHFPRIVHCDIPRRMLANTPKQTVNCVLTLNIYYEKLLLFLWFWMLFVCLANVANCASWLTTMCMPERSQRRIRSYITVHKNSVYMENFVRALGADGIFILDQIALNLGDLPASYLSLALYNVIVEFDRETTRLLEIETKEHHPHSVQYKDV